MTSADPRPALLACFVLAMRFWQDLIHLWDLLVLTPSVCEQILARIYDRRLSIPRASGSGVSRGRLR